MRKPFGKPGLARIVPTRRVSESALPMARVLPSGLNATEVIRPVWPVRGAPTGRLVARSHTRTVWSGLVLARILPSGLNATEVIGPTGPVRAVICRWAATSHNKMVPVSLPVARVLPSGLNATEMAGLVLLVKRPGLLWHAHGPPARSRTKMPSALPLASVVRFGLNATE